jgi:hypothetical protein
VGKIQRMCSERWQAYWYCRQLSQHSNQMQPGPLGNPDSIPGRVKTFLLCTAVQTGYGSLPACSPVNTVGYFHRIKRRSVMLTTQRHLVPTEESVDRARR